MRECTHIKGSNHDLRFFAVLVMVMGASFYVHAAPVFGPKSFVRNTGTPDEFQQVFQLQGSASSFKIIIENGHPDGTNRVTSAHVWLNGEEIIGPQSFDREVSEIRMPVRLLSSNDLRIRLEGSPGGVLNIRISAVIGAAGGFVASSGGARLSVPPGVIDHEIQASIDDVAVDGL